MRTKLLLLLTLAACGGDDAMMPGDDVVADTIPDTRFDATPGDDLDTADDSVFALACDDGPCTFECSVDDGAFAACDDALALSYLTVGEHTLAARAIDGDGDIDETPATHTWSLVFGWRALAGARRTTCAIAGDGALYCWGNENGGGELGNGGGLQDSVAQATRVGTDADWESIVAGWTTYCGRRAGATYCWGSNYDGELGDPTIVGAAGVPTSIAHDFGRLSLGEYHGCGIDDDDALWCWGYGGDGELGLGDDLDHDTPQHVGTATWAQVSAGTYRTCGIQTDGALYCWGDDDVLAPARVGTRTDWVNVSAGSSHTCALDEDDALWCWGYNFRGELGDGTTTASTVPVQVAGTWRAVLASEHGTCAIDATGAVSCWGDNQRAQLGSAAPVAQASAPTPIDAAGVFTAVVGHEDLHCALGDRDILCWGDNQYASGGLGRGVLGGEPQVIAIDGGWTQVAVNTGGGCGVRANGTLACWGLGFHVGQDVAIAVSPIDVTADTDWHQVAVSPDGSLASGHACGVRDGGLWCWGLNGQGQLGDGTTTMRARPVQVPTGAEAWSFVATGSAQTCALTTGGRLSCWGDGVTSPAAITTPAATGWLSISVFGGRYTAIRTGGELWAWGLNPNGVVQATPVRIGTDADWVEGISTASGTTCARKTSGAIYCTDYTFSPTWPRGLLQVGTATDHARLIPFEGGACSMRAGELHCYWGTTSGWTDNFPSFDVNGMIPNPSGTWSQLSVNYGLRCGVRADGGRACAGFRFAGSLGDGFDERHPTATLLP